jgi:choloylglycine hydrolase
MGLYKGNEVMRRTRITKAAVIGVFVLIFLMTGNSVNACSTFLLKSGKIVVAGHNLDSGVPHVPGLVFINKRNVSKTGISWAVLISGNPDKTPPLAWTSKHASITFNPVGRDFPDDGMNEVGLFVGEMTLGETKFPLDPAKPSLFMSLWMQYVLDNFETVDQVIANASELNLNGWPWHFFTADKTGRSASLEFLDGKLVIHTGATMPIQVLCNSQYEQEMTRFKKFNGFGDDKPVILEDTRFVHAARLLQTYMPGIKPPVEYAFDMLRQLERGWTRWSLVCDLINLKVYFRTVKGQGIKSIGFGDFDLSCNSPAKYLDIHSELSGDVSKAFKDYSLDANKEHTKQAMEILSISPEFNLLIKTMGINLPELIERSATYPENTACQK